MTHQQDLQPKNDKAIFIRFFMMMKNYHISLFIYIYIYHSRKCCSTYTLSILFLYLKTYMKIAVYLRTLLLFF